MKTATSFSVLYMLLLLYFIFEMYTSYLQLYINDILCHCSVNYNCILYYLFLYAIYLQHILFCNSLMIFTVCTIVIVLCILLLLAMYLWYMLYCMTFFIYVLSFTLFYCYLVYHQRTSHILGS